MRSPAKDQEPIPGYRLIDRLGRGGYGEVWKAEAPGGLLKAIKFVYGDLNASGNASKPAEQELKALHRVKTIRHPYILSLERFETIEGQLVIVMELADRSMWDRFIECRSKSLPGIPREELLGYMEEAAEALDLMNIDYQIQHLDIKPQNLFLVHNHIKVADFGLAKDFEGRRGTMTGGVTPVYAAPETFEGWISRQTDQYSLAIVYQELQTGFRPLNGTSNRQLLMQHLSGRPDVSSLPANERDIILKALAKKPDQRFATCMELVKALRQASQEQSRSMTTVLSLSPPKSLALPAGSSRVNPPQVQQPKPEGMPQINQIPSAPLLSPTVDRTPSLQPQIKGRLPALITPKGGGTSPATRVSNTGLNTANRQPVPADTPKPANQTLRIEPTHEHGEIRPALIITLGGVASQVLSRLQLSFKHRLQPGVEVPHLRYLAIDTDPDILNRTDRNPTPLDANSVYIARLNRPAHYLRKEGLPSTDAWLSRESLFQIPRDQRTNSIRSLGRLAFLDHYQQILQRIRNEIDALMDRANLDEASTNLKLGVYTNVPRVYIVSSLLGGSGSGMLIDMAYLLRRELKRIGIEDPDIVGLLMTPTMEKGMVRSGPMTNAYATLTELNHFAQTQNQFECKFDTREAAVRDAGPPLKRATLFQLPRQLDNQCIRQASDMAAASLFQELLTPMGRALDEYHSRDESNLQEMLCRTVGIYRLSWPREQLLHLANHRLTAKILDGWSRKGDGFISNEVHGWVEENFFSRGLNPEILQASMNETVKNWIDGETDPVMKLLFKTAFEDLQTTETVETDKIHQLQEMLLKKLGRPGEEDQVTPESLATPIFELANRMMQESEQKLAELAVHFVERPGHRFAAAEDAIRLLSDKLHFLEKKFIKQVDSHDSEARQLVAAIWGNGSVMVPTTRLIRRITNHSELIQAMIRYAWVRMQSMFARAMMSIYRVLSNSIPEYLRELNSCWNNVEELKNKLGPAPAEFESPLPHDHWILPDNCKTLGEAANLLIEGITLEELLRFEEILQGEIRQRSRGVVSICAKPEKYFPRFQLICQKLGKEFLESRLLNASPSEVFFCHRPDMQSAQREIHRAYEEASPEYSDARNINGTQIVSIGVPMDMAGDEFRRLCVDILGEVDLLTSESRGEIIFYRELRGLHLSMLPQLSPMAREAFEVTWSEEGINPHSRLDVNWSSPSYLPNNH
jgi:eukaryotic-like serine/threonine-protein kinase